MKHQRIKNAASATASSYASDHAQPASSAGTYRHQGQGKPCTTSGCYMKLPDKMISPPVHDSSCYSRCSSAVDVTGRSPQFLQPGCFSRRMHMPRRAKTRQGEIFLAHIILHTRLLHHAAACAKTRRTTKQAHLTFTVDQAAPVGSCTSGRAGSR